LGVVVGISVGVDQALGVGLEFGVGVGVKPGTVRRQIPCMFVQGLVHG